ncbi:hypothetical protein EON81_05795 [bacterium]|nr:MAG: hypothetical protein EON81_05795 [bacterium]
MKLRTILVSAFSLVSAASFAAADLVINRVLINPKGGPVVGGTTDPSSGLELFEIKNVGDASINLSTSSVALVVIDNERDNHGELDNYFPLSGTLAPGEGIIVRDLNGAGAVTPVLNPNGTTYTTTTASSQFGIELSNSGGNYILVSGFNATLAQPKVNTELDTNNNLVLDFTVTPATTDDLWTGQLDAIVTHPGDGQTQGNYTTSFTTPHKVVSVDTGSFSADYVFRLYKTVSGVNIYDEAIGTDLADYNTSSQRVPFFSNIKTSAEFMALASGAKTSGTTPALTFVGSGTVPGNIAGYVTLGCSGNWTNWTGFTNVAVGATNYFH